MKFYKYLYVGDTVKEPAKVKRKLKLHAGQMIYVIGLAGGEDNLEIYHSAYLKQRYYRQHPPVIVGIASGYEEAVEIVVKITKECLFARGDCNLKAYLRQRAGRKQLRQENPREGHGH